MTEIYRENPRNLYTVDWYFYDCVKINCDRRMQDQPLKRFFIDK